MKRTGPQGWHPLDVVVGAALTWLGKRLEGHRGQAWFPATLPLAPIDRALIQ